MILWCPNLSSLCDLSVLCASVVALNVIHHGGTENTEVAQRVI